MLATAINTGIASNTRLRKMLSTYINLSQSLYILDDDDLKYLDANPLHPHEVDKLVHTYKWVLLAFHQ